MIKAFLFDYDGVMTTGVQDGVPASRLADKIGVTQEKASEWIATIWNPYSTGAMSDEDAWFEIEKQYGKPISPEQRDIWYKWEELMPLLEMIELVKELKTKGYTVGLLSNVFPVTAQLIRENGGYQGFDFIVLSCEAGARKPDPKVYETALAQLKDVDVSEVIFLDDRERCIEGAEKLGIKGIHVTDHGKAIEEVHQLTAIL
jgi:epoxide hydrolase-like predicted phosphatase